MRLHRIAGLALVCAGLGAASAQAEGLTLTIEDVRNNAGTVVVLVFDDASAFDQWDYTRAVDYADIPAQAGAISHSFPNLTAEPYAIFLFHDENGDWDVTYRGDRLLEGVGASGAPNAEDMPDFAAASVGPGAVTVRLHYDE